MTLSEILEMFVQQNGQAVLKEQYGGTQVSNPAFVGDAIQATDGNWHSHKALFSLAVTGISLNTAGWISLFTTPTGINYFMPINYQIFSTSSSGIVASSSAVFSISAAGLVNLIDTNTYAYPASGSFINKSISSSTGIPANTAISLDLTTALLVGTPATVSVYMTGYCI